jgi:Glycosyltransferase 61
MVVREGNILQRLGIRLNLPMPFKLWAYRVLYGIRNCVAAFLRRLPGAWPLLGLPGSQIHSLKQWVEEVRAETLDRWKITKGPHYEIVGQPVTMRRPAPRTLGCGPVPNELTIDRHTVHAELFLAILPGARILGPEGAVITADGRLVGESTWPRVHFPNGRAWAGLTLPKCTEVRGHLYSVASPGASGYYHWVIELLPRLFALETLRWDDSRVVVNGPLTPWQEESLRLLGIESSRLLLLGAQYLRAEVLFLPSFLGDPSPHPVSCTWLRERLLPPVTPARKDRRIYVTRRIARGRRVINESELEPVLRKNGFEIIEAECLSFAEQIRLFSEAEMVVGPHGAGLTNIVFAPPECKVLELFQPTYVLASTYKIATCIGQEYWYLLGESAPNDGSDSKNMRDMLVGHDQLKTCLSKMLLPEVERREAADDGSNIFESQPQ